MGNPFIRSDAFQPSPAQQAPSGNGILARVPGEIIGSAARQLPLAAKGQPEMAEVVVHDVRDLGSIRITYQLNSYTHGRSRHWHWRAVKAERLDQP